MSTLFVLDTNCRPGFEVRVHQVALDNGGFVSYEFKEHEKLEMPAEHAMKFLKDEAWIVIDHEGKRVRPITDVKAGQEIPKLGPNQVVATWDELTAVALLVRTMMRRGGEKFKKGSKKDDLIEFLTSDSAMKGKADDHIPSDAGDEAGDVGGGISTAEVDKMLGDGDEDG